MKAFVFLLLAAILFYSCDKLKTEPFTGEWVMSESSPMYGIIKAESVFPLSIKIIKEDIFYKLDIPQLRQELMRSVNPKESGLVEDMFKYQLSADKHFLVNISDPSSIILYNEDNKTITTPWGWFKRK